MSSVGWRRERLQAGTTAALACRRKHVVGKGALVRLEGLEVRADLNGCIGVLIGRVSESGRAPVMLVSSEVHIGTTLMVKPSNMRAVA